MQKSGRWICLLLISLNIILLLKMFLDIQQWTGQVDRETFSVVMLILFLLATVGIFGIVFKKTGLVYLYCLISFVPHGLYLLGTPSLYALIGVTHIAVFVIYQLIK